MEGKLTSWNAKNGSVVYFAISSPLTLSITSDGVPRSANTKNVQREDVFQDLQKIVSRSGFQGLSVSNML